MDLRSCAHCGKLLKPDACPVQDAVDLGGGATPAACSYDAWLGRYSPAGRHMWSRLFGGPGEERGFSVAADREGSVVVTGYFSGSIDFGGGSLSSAGQSDIFVAKYDSSGAHLWSRRLGGPGNDAGNHVAVDADGNVLVTGYFSNTADFAGTLLTSAGKNDIFLTKLSATGELRGVRGFGGPSSDAGLGVSVDAQGNVVCAGGFTESVDFGSGALTSAGRDDVLVASFDSGGRPQWSQRLGGAGDDDATGVAKNAADEVFVVGYCHDAFAVGPTPVQSAGGADALLVKLSAIGTPLWAQLRRRSGGRVHRAGARRARAALAERHFHRQHRPGRRTASWNERSGSARGAACRRWRAPGVQSLWRRQ